VANAPDGDALDELTAFVVGRRAPDRVPIGGERRDRLEVDRGPRVRISHADTVPSSTRNFGYAPDTRVDRVIA
jgi:hypothetical protein